MLRPNPVTGVLEEDGVLAPPVLQATPESTGGGTPAPALAPAQVAAFPEETHRVEVSGPQTTTTKPTEGSQQALTQVREARGIESAAGDQEIGHKVIEHLQATTLAEQQAELARKSLAQAEAVQKANAIEVKRLMAETEKRRAAEEKAAHPKTYWEDKGVPARILGGLLMIGGGAAAGLARQPNSAALAYKEAEAEDRQRKIEDFKNAKEFRLLAEHDVVAAKAALGDKLAQITKDEITKSNLLVKNAEVLAKRTGLPHVIANAQQLKAARDAENAEKLLRLEQHYDQQVQGGRRTTSDTQNSSPGAAGKPNPLQIPGWDGGVVGLAATPGEAGKLREAHAAGHSLGDLVDELKNNVSQFGAVINPASEGGAAAAQRRDILQTQIAGKLTIANQTGTLQAGEFARYKGMTQPGWLQAALGKPEQFSATMDSLKTDTKRGYERMAQSQGVNPAGPKATSEGSAAPAAKPKLTRAEATSDLARVTKRLQALPKGSRERAEAEELRRLIIQQGDAVQ